MFKLALCQMAGATEKKESMARAESCIREAAAAGAKVVALPEMWICPYSNSYFVKSAETEDGEAVGFMSRLAAELEIYLIGGTIAELVPRTAEDGASEEPSAPAGFGAATNTADSGAATNTAEPGASCAAAKSSAPENSGADIYNTCFCFGPDGQIIGKHRKVHLFDIDIKGKFTFRESDTLTAGNQLTVIDTEFCRIGVAICYDVRFTEWMRAMALDGAKLIVLPAAFNCTTGPVHWELTMRARALDNQLYFAACAPAKEDDGIFQAYGHSMVVDPWGTVVASCEDEKTIIYADIDLDYVDSVRQQLPLLKHRRPELY